MRIPGSRRVWRLAQDAYRRMTGGAVILAVHRVTQLAFDPQWLAVRPQTFEIQMRFLRKRFRPMPLGELVERQGSGSIPQNTVVVTFDDGYCDNFHEAKPILDKYEIPATIFVATDNVDGKREFWWDELEYLLFSPAILPEFLELELKGRRCRWHLANAGPQIESMQPSKI